jgi:hypothetical protein
MPRLSLDTNRDGDDLITRGLGDLLTELSPWILIATI